MRLLKHEHGFDQPLGLLGDCHRRIEHFMAILCKVAWEAPEDHLPKLYRDALEKALDYFSQAAPKHTEDEEDSLFPRISGNSEAGRLISELEEEHQAAEPLHETVDKLGRLWLETGHLEGEDRGEFRFKVESLQQLYRDHIKREDEELFPLAATLLDQEALRRVGEEMASRRGLGPGNGVLSP